MSFLLDFGKLVFCRGMLLLIVRGHSVVNVCPDKHKHVYNHYGFFILAIGSVYSVMDPQLAKM